MQNKNEQKNVNKVSKPRKGKSMFVRIMSVLLILAMLIPTIISALAVIV